MTKYSRFNPIYRLQKWLDSVPGQTFMNYAYSWGASIVIAGALFKLTHLPGANFMLFLGMGTEVLVFFISGFDRPFDKTEDGKDLPTHVQLDDESASETVDVLPNGIDMAAVAAVGGGIGGGAGISGGAGGGTIIIGGGGHAGNAEYPEGSDVAASSETVENAAGGAGGAVFAGGIVAPELPELNPDMEDATNNYVEELKKLTETLQKVSEQSERLTRDSEEMENLNRTLTSISKVYEMQLKGASQQIGTIDEINEQTRKMAAQIAELNQIYARMIEAMTTNMPKGV